MIEKIICTLIDTENNCYLQPLLSNFYLIYFISQCSQNQLFLSLKLSRTSSLLSSLNHAETTLDSGSKMMVALSVIKPPHSSISALSSSYTCFLCISHHKLRPLLSLSPSHSNWAGRSMALECFKWSLEAIYHIALLIHSSGILTTSS